MVGTGNAVAGPLTDQRPVVGIGAGIEVDPAVPGYKRAVLHHPGLDGTAGCVAPRGFKRLFHGQGQPHGTASRAA